MGISDLEWWCGYIETKPNMSDKNTQLKTVLVILTIPLSYLSNLRLMFVHRLGKPCELASVVRVHRNLSPVTCVCCGTNGQLCDVEVIRWKNSSSLCWQKHSLRRLEPCLGLNWEIQETCTLTVYLAFCQCVFLCRIASYSPLLYSEVNLCFVCWFRYELDLSLLADDTDESHILDADSVLLIDRVCWRYWAALIGQLWTILMADPMTICSGCAMAATTRWCSMDA